MTAPAHDHRTATGGAPDDPGDPGGPVARNPRAEAQAVVGGRYEARVLEPSPPAVVDGEWFADDPVAVGPDVERPVVGPVGSADLTWDQWLADQPELAPWASARWLGAYRRLGQLPATWPETRTALHRLAVYVLSPARRRVNGKMALRFTFGGLGTPCFGADEQVRLAGTRIVRQRGTDAAAQDVTTLAEAAGFVLDGPPDLAWAESFDVPPAGDVDEPLAVDPAAATLLGDWTGFAWSVLEAARADPASTDPNRIQLWPEHFDAAFDCLPAERRVTLGASPGDQAVPEPYLYVLPWDFGAAPPSEVWNAEHFNGAILPFGELGGQADQRGTALAFLRQGRDLMAG
jgi:hypothetical protein